MRIDKNRSVHFRKAKKLELRYRMIKKLTIGTMIITIAICSNQFDMPNKGSEVITPTVEYNQTIEKKELPPIAKEETSTTEYVPIPPKEEPSKVIENDEVIKEEPQKDIIEPNKDEPQEIPAERPVEEEPQTNEQGVNQPTNNEKEIVEEKTKEKKKMIALSYDDGPSKTLTLELLSVLKENDCTATFFVLGNKVKQYSDIIYEIHSSGNEIGNHSYNHSDFSKLTKDQIINQFNKTEEAIYEVIGEYPTFFRPPYGALSNNVRESIESPLALWSIDSNDWRSISDEQVIDNIISSLKDGKIILMHDIHKRTIEVSKIIIPMIKDLGYEIVSLEELFENNNVKLEDGVVYSKVKKN